MKKGIFIISVLLLSILLYSNQNFALENGYKLQNDIEYLAKEMHSTPKKLDQNTYFISDNREETRKKIERETNGDRSSGTIQYGYVVRGYKIDVPSGQLCVVKSSAYVKAIYEQNVYRFLNCQGVTWTAAGSNQYSVTPSTGNYHISDDGRYLTVSGDFNVETAISHSLSSSFGAAGWSIGGSVGGEIYVRRWIIKTFEFDGNYEGANLLN